jgi:enoyl-CoA hydratase/carnithine racemase
MAVMFRLAIDGPVARIVIDRGEKRNAVPIAQWHKLEKCFAEAHASAARLIVIVSADPASFCAGADISEMDHLIADVKKRHVFRGAMGSALDRIRGSNKPTLAQIEGGCFGAGVSLAMACDLRLAGPRSTYAITPARFGISYPQSDLKRLVELVGPGQAARLLYTAEMIDAEEARRIGLIELVCSDGRCGTEVIERIAGNAPYSLSALKATMAGRFGVDDRFDAAFSSKDFAEGLDAFRSGRKPEFS